MIPISEPSLSDLERRYLLEAFDSGWISSRGAFIARAESTLAQVTDLPHAAVVSNGTTALHLALLAVGVGPGDEVIVPALSYVASVNAVLYTGAVPVLVDVSPTDWCVDPAAVEAALSDRTTAVMGVDLFGHPADYPELARRCAAHATAVVADAAESVGALVDARPATRGADVLTYSFFGNKVVTSGEGGAVVTDSPGIDARVRQLRNQGNNPDRSYVHDVLGYNYRMTNLSAAVLTGQLERLDELLTERERVVSRYRRHLDRDDRFVQQQVGPDVRPSPWIHTVRVVGATAPQRDAVMREMSEQGIETRPAFPVLADLPYASSRVSGRLTSAEEVAREGISLPTFPGLSDDAVDRVVTALGDAVAKVLARPTP